MSVILGSARIDEKGNIIGGTAGDQTGREVCTENYYNHSQGWNGIRPITPLLANKIAQAMLDACNNNNIGYDQGQRESVIDAWKRSGSIKAITTPCEADCSSLVRLCVWQASGKDPGNFTTGNAMQMLTATGLFSKVVLVASSKNLCTGDILCTRTKGHIVVVVEGRERSVKVDDEPAKETVDTSNKAEKYTVTTLLNIRSAAGANSPWIGTLTKGTTVKFLGETVLVNGTKWYKVKSSTYEGWVSSKHLRKK